MTIVNHLEQYLGTLDEGWADSGFQRSVGDIQVVRFRDVPFPETSTFSTLGLGWDALTLPDGRSVRQELIFAVHDRFPKDDVASFLLTFAEHVRSSQKALLRGEVIGPGDSLIPNVRVNAVYASMPSIYPDGLAVYSETDPPTVVVWLIPVLGDEVAIVKSKGWNHFEDLLESTNPDLLDLNRGPIIDKL